MGRGSTDNGAGALEVARPFESNEVERVVAEIDPLADNGGRATLD